MNAYKSLFDAQKRLSSELRRAGVDSRRQKLKALRKWILSHRTTIQEAIAKDLDKPASESDITEIYPLLAETRLAEQRLHEWTRPVPVESSLAFLGSRAFVQYEALGTSLIMSPWNYPLLLALGPAVSSIAAGNTITLKPSEYTPNTNIIIQQMLDELFSPEEFLLVEGGAEEAKSLLELPFDKVFFTGSPTVGRIVMQAAARHLSSVTLELGGKSPVIIDASADLQDAAEKIAWGKWTNAGQTCVAPDYIFIDATVKDSFLSLLEKEALKYRNKENYTSIINESHWDRLEALKQDALQHGSQVAFGGEGDREQRRMYPIVLTNLSSSMKITQEEIFGPILPLFTFTDLSEVVDYVNHRPKPLALYLYSKSTKSRKKIMTATTSGSLVINDNVIQFGHPHLPMGGVGQSGLGKSHGHEGFKAFSNARSIIRQRVGHTVPKLVYPPYTTHKLKLINWLIKYF